MRFGCEKWLAQGHSCSVAQLRIDPGHLTPWLHSLHHWAPFWKHLPHWSKREEGKGQSNPRVSLSGLVLPPPTPPPHTHTHFHFRMKPIHSCQLITIMKCKSQAGQMIRHGRTSAWATSVREETCARRGKGPAQGCTQRAVSWAWGIAWEKWMSWTTRGFENLLCTFLKEVGWAFTGLEQSRLGWRKHRKSHLLLSFSFKPSR